MAELTALFAAARAGEKQSLERIFAILYPDLKNIARARLSRGRRLTMMNTTVLVHECFLRFRKLDQIQLEDRQHFLAYAARVIRTVIVDIVRLEQAEKRGGSEPALTLDTNLIDNLPNEQSEVLAVAEALESLAAVDPRLASIVEMRYFAGFTEEEIADALAISPRTVRRAWDKARAFLMVALKR